MENNRATGRSTRQVDECIQEFFTTGKTLCLDHWEDGNNRNANRTLYERVLKRLYSEHGHLADRFIKVPYENTIILDRK